jgi:tetratricopeptide (TPR) repeat protein
VPDRASTFFLTVAVAAVMSIGALPGRGQEAGQAQAGQPAQKNWKDRPEYDLFNAIVKEQDPIKKLALLTSWKEKYPASDYADARLQIYLQTYSALNQPTKVFETGNEVLQANPKDLTALYLMALNALRLTKPSPDDLSSGEKAANGLLSNLDSFFDPSKKPATTNDAAWAQAKIQTETLAHTTLGWVALQKKDDETAEREFSKVLQLNPKSSTTNGSPVDSAQVSYWLGTAIVQEKKPEKVPEALYQFARAASLDASQGGLPPAARQPYDNYFVKAYAQFHGQDEAGLKELRELAKSQPLPPAGFTIKDVNQLSAEKEEKQRKENPGLSLWTTLKQALTAADGEQYFNTNMKGAEVPGGANGVQTFKGKLISAKPALRPKALVLSVGDGTTPDATLNLDAPLPGKAEPGVDIEFSGVPSSFTKDPYHITFDVEKKKIADWPGKDAAPVRHATHAKKKG